jgi:transposase
MCLSFCSCLCTLRSKCTEQISGGAGASTLLRPHTRSHCSAHTMSSFTPQLKHHILKHYSVHSRDRSFAALARLYAVPGGKQTVQQWHRRWNGSAASLENKARSGRPRTLTRRQVNDYIRTPIKNKRRAHATVHYPDLLPALRQKIGKQISLRTLQRYGKEELGIKLKHTQRRTASECA